MIVTFNMSVLTTKWTIYFLLWAIVREGTSTCTSKKTLIVWFNYSSLQPTAIVVDVKADAKAIHDANAEPKIVASILPLRTPEQCAQINDEYRALDGNKPLVDDKYVPYENFEATYQDLLFALVKDYNTVLSMFLGKFCENKDETLITIVLTLVKDMEAFKGVYASQHGKDLNGGTENQRHPFQNMMKVWIKKNREPDGPVDTNAVDHDAVELIKEQPSWDKNRDYLETVLIRKSIKHSAAVLKSYLEKNNQIDIKTEISNTIKNHDLVYAYVSLARFIEDKYTYLAQLLHNHSDNENEHWAVWIMVVSIIRDHELAMVKSVFQELYQTTLVDFLLQKKGEHTFIETMAKLVSSCHAESFGGSPPTPTPPSPTPSLESDDPQ